MQHLLNKLANKTRTTNIEQVKVQDGLATTPTEMYQATQMGIPISSQLLSESNFCDGEVSPLTDVPFMFRRGVDVGDIIAYQESSQSKVKEVYSKTISHD